eukprot:g8086.t1
MIRLIACAALVYSCAAATTAMDQASMTTAEIESCASRWKQDFRDVRPDFPRADRSCPLLQGGAWQDPEPATHTITCSGSDARKCAMDALALTDHNIVVVKLAAGTYSWPGQLRVPWTKQLTIEGAGKTATIIDGGFPGNCVYLDHANYQAGPLFRLRHLTMKQCGKQNSGEGGLLSTGYAGTFVAEYVLFTDNKAWVAAVARINQFGRHGPSRFRYCDFTKTDATNNSQDGVMRLYASAIFEHCNFYDNPKGVFYMHGGQHSRSHMTLVTKNCVWRNNVGMGVANLFRAGSWTAENDRFIGNRWGQSYTGGVLTISSSGNNKIPASFRCKSCYFEATQHPGGGYGFFSIHSAYKPESRITLIDSTLKGYGTNDIQFYSTAPKAADDPQWFTSLNTTFDNVDLSHDWELSPATCTAACGTGAQCNATA